jgi:hypothetical protein
MANERMSLPHAKEKGGPGKPDKQEKAGRSGEGSRSVIPHLRADMKARAAAKIGKRADRDA